MIKFERTETWGFEHSLRGMRNPKNSWHLNDSEMVEKLCEGDDLPEFPEYEFIVGPKDMDLATRLIKAGNEHRKFLRQIFVSVDITAPLYWWKEYDTYKVGTVANSCSTMHKIHSKEFTLDDFSHEHLERVVEDVGGDSAPVWDFLRPLDYTIEMLNKARELYLDTKDKRYWWQMIQLLPSSYNQKRTVTLNYENILSMVRQRKHHKLDEWRIGFIEWARTLPYAQEFIFFDEVNE